jgi:adenine-specific DNA methylase
LLRRAEALERASSSFSIGSDKLRSIEDVHIVGYIKKRNRKGLKSYILEESVKTEDGDVLELINLEEENERSGKTSDLKEKRWGMIRQELKDLRQEETLDKLPKIFIL